jgi:hypothetical protein
MVSRTSEANYGKLSKSFMQQWFTKTGASITALNFEKGQRGMAIGHNSKPSSNPRGTLKRLCTNYTNGP